MTNIVLILILLFSPLFAEGMDDSRLMPRNNFVDEWVKSEKLQRYTEADLYGFINGGAEVFLELGFEQLTLQDYTSNEDELSIEIYRMKDQVAATGIYLMKCGKENPTPDIHVRNTINPYQALFHKDKYLVKIANHSGNKKYIPVIVRLAAAIAEQLPDDKKIKELELLPDEGLQAGSIRLIRGPFTLQAIYTFGDGDILKLAGSATAVAADYIGPGSERFTLIVARYSDDSSAKAAYAYIRDHLDKYLEVIYWKKDKFLLKDFNDEYVLGTLKSRQLEIKVNLQRIDDIK